MKVQELTFVSEVRTATHLFVNGHIAEVTCYLSKPDLFHVRVGKAYNGAWNEMSGEYDYGLMDEQEVNLLLATIETWR